MPCRRPSVRMALGEMVDAGPGAADLGGEPNPRIGCRPAYIPRVPSANALIASDHSRLNTERIEATRSPRPGRRT